MTLAEDMREMCDMSKRTPDKGHCWIGSMDGAQAYTIVRNHLFAPEADKAYDPAALGVQEKHHACPGEGSDGGSAKPEWFDCGDGDLRGEPEGHAAVIKVSADEEPVAPEQLYVEEPVAFAAAVTTGGEPIKPVQHGVADALSAGGAKKPHRRGDAPPQTGVNALPTMRCEIGAPLPAGNTPAKLASARRPLAPIGPRDLAAADTVATGAEVVLAPTHLCRDGAPLEQLHDEFKEPVAFTAAVATGGEPINPEQHAAVEEQERHAHEALDGLGGSAKKRQRRDDAPPETGPASSMLPGGGCEISSDKIPFDNTLEPDRLSFGTLVATHVLLLEGETPTSLVAIAATLVATHVLLPEGETPTSLVAIAAAVMATHVLHPEGKTPTTEGEMPTSLVAIAAAVAATHVLHSEGETPTSLVAVAAAVATGGEPVEPEQHAAAADGADEPEQCALGEFNRLDGNAYATAAEPSGRANELLQGSANGPEQRAHGDPDGLDGNAYATAAETGVGQGESLPHASANEPEQRAHAEPNGLEGNASVTAGTEAGIASGFSDAPPETSTEALPTTRRELGMPLPAGDTPAKLASALRPPVPIGPRAESTEPEWLAIAAEILYAGSDSLSDGAFEAAAEASVDPTSWQDSDLDSFDVDLSDATGRAGRLEDAPQALAPIVEETAGGIAALAPAGAGAVRELAAADAVTTGAMATFAHTQPCHDGANGFVAAVRWAFNAVVRHMQPIIIGFLLTYLAYLAAARAVSTADTTARVVPGFAVPRVLASHDLNWLHDSEAYLAGAGAARELGVSTPIGPFAVMASSRRALLLPAAWASPPAPAHLHSSSCAFPASSMSPGGVYEISSDEIVFAGDTLECGFASNGYDSPGRGGADGIGAEEPKYVPDKANQDQKPGGFSLATGRPPGDTAAGALSTGKLESRCGPPGGTAAGAISAGALKLESTGRPPGGAAAGALSAGAIKIESKRGLLGHAAASALSAGAIKLESTGRPLDNAAAGALSAGANEPESKRGRLGHAAADELSTGRPPGGEADAGALSAGAIKLERTGRPLDDAAVGALSAGGRRGPPGGAAAGAISAGALKLESTSRPPGGAAAGALLAGAVKIECKRGLLGHGAASALSAGAIKLESTGRPLDDAAAGALSAGAIKIESKRGLLDDAAASALSAGANEPESKRSWLGHAAADELSTGRPPGGEDAGALSAGAIKLESTGRPLDDAAAGALSAGAIKIESKRGLLDDADAAASALSTGANEPESKRGWLGHAAADELSTDGPPGGEDAGALSTGAIKIESTGRPPDDAAAGALSTGRPPGNAAAGAGALLVSPPSPRSQADCPAARPLALSRRASPSSRVRTTQSATWR